MVRSSSSLGLMCIITWRAFETFSGLAKQSYDVLTMIGSINYKKMNTGIFSYPLTFLSCHHEVDISDSE